MAKWMENLTERQRAAYDAATDRAIFFEFYMTGFRDGLTDPVATGKPTDRSATDKFTVRPVTTKAA